MKLTIGRRIKLKQSKCQTNHSCFGDKNFILGCSVPIQNQFNYWNVVSFSWWSTPNKNEAGCKSNMTMCKSYQCVYKYQLSSFSKVLFIPYHLNSFTCPVTVTDCIIWPTYFHMFTIRYLQSSKQNSMVHALGTRFSSCTWQKSKSSQLFHVNGISVSQKKHPKNFSPSPKWTNTMSCVNEIDNGQWRLRLKSICQTNYSSFGFGDKNFILGQLGVSCAYPKWIPLLKCNFFFVKNHDPHWTMKLDASPTWPCAIFCVVDLGTWASRKQHVNQIIHFWGTRFSSWSWCAYPKSKSESSRFSKCNFSFVKNYPQWNWMQVQHDPMQCFVRSKWAQVPQSNMPIKLFMLWVQTFHHVARCCSPGWHTFGQNTSFSTWVYVATVRVSIPMFFTWTRFLR